VAPLAAEQQPMEPDLVLVKSMDLQHSLKVGPFFRSQKTPKNIG
jgi:hypothetical protein